MVLVVPRPGDGDVPSRTEVIAEAVEGVGVRGEDLVDFAADGIHAERGHAA